MSLGKSLILSPKKYMLGLRVDSGDADDITIMGPTIESSWDPNLLTCKYMLRINDNKRIKILYWWSRASWKSVDEKIAAVKVARDRKAKIHHSESCPSGPLFQAISHSSNYFTLSTQHLNPSIG